MSLNRTSKCSLNTSRLSDSTTSLGYITLYVGFTAGKQLNPSYNWWGTTVSSTNLCRCKQELSKPICEWLPSLGSRATGSRRCAVPINVPFVSISNLKIKSLTIGSEGNEVSICWCFWFWEQNTILVKVSWRWSSSKLRCPWTSVTDFLFSLLLI